MVNDSYGPLYITADGTRSRMRGGGDEDCAAKVNDSYVPLYITADGMQIRMRGEVTRIVLQWLMIVMLTCMLQPTECRAECVGR